MQQSTPGARAAFILGVIGLARVSARGSAKIVNQNSMKEEAIGMIVMGGVFTALGVILLSSYGFASWGISNTRAGQRWERWFGEERAILILRFVAGPLLILISAVAIWAALSGKMPK